MPDNIDRVFSFLNSRNSVDELDLDNNEARLTQVAKSEERANGV